MTARYFRILGAIVTVLVTSPVASAMPFLPASPVTLSQQMSEARIVFVATPSCSCFDPKATFQGTTVVRIDSVIKSHAMIAGCRCATINRYIPIDPAKPCQYLYLCDVTNGQLDAFMGMSCELNSKLADYLAGAWKVRDEAAQTRLEYFSKYLNHSEEAISDDAFLEFANAEYKDLRSVAKKLDPKTLTRWLKDEKTRVSRLGLYASMLGECGATSDAEFLPSMLVGSNADSTSGIEGILTGYLKLQPKEAWSYIRGVIFGGSNFERRYGALRARLRFVVEFRPDLIGKAEVVSGVSTMLSQDDIADLVIEDLRNWRCWDMTDRVLALFELKTHKEQPIIRRSILRFALSAAATKPKARAFVDAQRKLNAIEVEDVEEILRSEDGDKRKETPPAKSGK